VIVNLSRMNRVIEINESALSCTVEPGITFSELEAILNKRGFRFLMSPENGISSRKRSGLIFKPNSLLILDTKSLIKTLVPTPKNFLHLMVKGFRIIPKHLKWIAAQTLTQKE